jgi:dTDP-4-amino-4,6-dideoxygalactose transaminase
MRERILLSRPQTSGYEQQYIEAALKEDWIVPLGPDVNEFEHRLEEYLNVDNVVALSAGTAAIHLGLVMLGVTKGDEVICQSLTFSASANPVCYCGASPVFVDSEKDTWNMDPTVLEEAIKDRIKVTGKKPKAIIPVHLYGMPAKLNEILDIAQRYDIPVLEDAAEALGSEYHGKKCGTFGQYGALSFNGNKMITTSGGGALICPSKEAADRVKFYSTQARENRPYYYHEVIGYNYRLSNISAAIGRGQMHELKDRVSRRQAIHDIYARELSAINGITVHNNPSKDYSSNFWLTTILIDPTLGITPDQLRLKLEEDNIESRLLWRPMHMQPVYKDAPYYGGHVSEDLFNIGLCLPSGASLKDEDIMFVIEKIKKAISKA